MRLPPALQELFEPVAAPVYTAAVPERERERGREEERQASAVGRRQRQQGGGERFEVAC
jgi:hypothetical protein